MNASTLGERLRGWAFRKSSVKALLMIGSRARGGGSIGSSDVGSDWDFQVVSDDVAAFRDAGWMMRENIGVPLAYIVRMGRLGSVSKVSVVFKDGELDLVIIPASLLWLSGALSRLGIVEHFPRASVALRNLGAVWKGGVYVVKGDLCVRSVIDAVGKMSNVGRLDDRDICALANGFICDYVSAKRKLQRGELVAAQRWLHVHLAEVNFQLLHEWRQRVGVTSFPDARRVEVVLSKEELNLIEVSVTPNEASLSVAIEKCADSCVDLLGKLVGSQWSWPELPSSLSRKQFRDDVL